jgi:hypothetical protein
MGKSNTKKQEEEVKTLEQVEQVLEERNEELINEETAAEMSAPQEPQSIEAIKDAFEETEMAENVPDDGLEHTTIEDVEESVVEPIKEVLDEAKELQEEKKELLEKLPESTPEEASKEIEKQIEKVEEFKKKLEDHNKNKTNSQLIHSWNGVNYSF